MRYIPIVWISYAHTNAKTEGRIFTSIPQNVNFKIKFVSRREEPQLKKRSTIAETIDWLVGIKHYNWTVRSWCSASISIQTIALHLMHKYESTKFPFKWSKNCKLPFFLYNTKTCNLIWKARLMLFLHYMFNYFLHHTLHS